LPEFFKQWLVELSPSHYVNGLRAPLILIHAAHDPSIPAQQSLELAEAARAHGIESRLTILQMYGHTYPALPKPSVASIFGFYIPEVARFLAVINHVLAMR
jgi:dipeptidyl aminopeptidase/acylaminoacyl peptidase